jgi:hypothetical protein
MLAGERTVDPVPVRTPSAGELKTQLSDRISSLEGEIAITEGLIRAANPGATSRQDALSGNERMGTVNNPIPVPITVDNRQTKQGTGSTPGTPAPREASSPGTGAPTNSTIAYSQAMENIYSANMLNIELEIRGDPYWLGESNLQSSARFVDDAQYMKVHDAASPKQSATGTKHLLAQNQSPSGTAGQLTQSPYADYTEGDVSFELLFRTGAIPDESTGLVNVSNLSRLGMVNNKAGSSMRVFSGWFTATEVKSQFKDGKFTQRIKAYKSITDADMTVDTALQMASTQSPTQGSPMQPNKGAVQVSNLAPVPGVASEGYNQAGITAGQPPGQVMTIPAVPDPVPVNNTLQSDLPSQIIANQRGIIAY